MTEWNASDYFQQSSLQAAMADELLSQLTLQGDERVLDVGCGDGKITAAIARRVPAGSVLGVDPSRDMIAFASQRFTPFEYSNLRFELADARRLNYRREFDLVVSFNALHWVPQQADALRSIHHALQPTGQAILRFVPEGPRTSLEDVIEQTRCDARWAQAFADFEKPYVHFTSEAYRALAEGCGFRVVTLQMDDKAWDYHTREAFAAFAQATFIEWTRRLPEDQRMQFITDVLDRYQRIAANSPAEQHTFKFYQLQTVLAPAN